MEPNGVTVRSYVNDFLKRDLDNYLHRNTVVAEIIEKKIKQAEHERKAMAGVKKLAKERAKKLIFTIRNLEIVEFIITTSKKRKDTKQLFLLLREILLLDQLQRLEI